MKYKAINRETEQVEYTVKAKSRREAMSFMSVIDPGNIKYFIVEKDKYKTVDKVVKEKVNNKVSAANDGFLKDLEQKNKLCNT